MSLRSSLFLNLANLYLVLACIISVHGIKYSQKEIDDAFVKMIKRERLYKPLDNQLGCWPQNIIPYSIQPGFTPEQRIHIYRHIYQIQNKTCLRWVEKATMSGVKKQVVFVRQTIDPGDCYTSEFGDSKSEIGITINITLGDRCFPVESVIHEMLHALGFVHEHQRIDRYCYVIVDEDFARHDSNFKIVYGDEAYEKWPYDKRSITHYRRINNVIRDKDEPFRGLLWKHRLGDSHGWWGEIGKSYGKLTCLDAFKINYRFCGAPDFCATRPEICQQIEEEELQEGCKDIYLDIANGTAKPNPDLVNLSNSGNL